MTTNNNQNNRSIEQIFQQQRNRKVKRKQHQMTTRSGATTTRKEHDMQVTPRQAKQNAAAEHLKNLVGNRMKDFGQQVDRAKSTNDQNLKESKNKPPFWFNGDDLIIENIEKFNIFHESHEWMQDDLPLKQLCRNFLNRQKEEESKTLARQVDRAKSNYQQIKNSNDRLKQKIQDERLVENVPFKKMGDDVSIEDINRFDDWANNHPMMNDADKQELQKLSDHWRNADNEPEEIVSTQLELDGKTEELDRFWDEFDRTVREKGLTDEGMKAGKNFARQYAKKHGISLKPDPAWIKEPDPKKALDAAIDAFAKGEIGTDELMKAYDAIDAKKDGQVKDDQIGSNYQDISDLNPDQLKQEYDRFISSVDYPEKPVDFETVEKQTEQLKQFRQAFEKHRDKAVAKADRTQAQVEALKKRAKVAVDKNPEIQALKKREKELRTELHQQRTANNRSRKLRAEADRIQPSENPFKADF